MLHSRLRLSHQTPQDNAFNRIDWVKCFITLLGNSWRWRMTSVRKNLSSISTRVNSGNHLWKDMSETSKKKSCCVVLCWEKSQRLQTKLTTLATSGVVTRIMRWLAWTITNETHIVAARYVFFIQRPPSTPREAVEKTVQTKGASN